MLSYETLKNKAREFLAATGLRVEEFQQLLPVFESLGVLFPAACGVIWECERVHT
jgi:hypothetical protein